MADLGLKPADRDVQADDVSALLADIPPKDDTNPGNYHSRYLQFVESLSKEGLSLRDSLRDIVYNDYSMWTDQANLLGKQFFEILFGDDMGDGLWRRYRRGVNGRVLNFDVSVFRLAIARSDFCPEKLRESQVIAQQAREACFCMAEGRIAMLKLPFPYAHLAAFDEHVKHAKSACSATQR